MPKILPANLKEILLDAMSVAETSIEASEYLATMVKQLLIETKMLDKFSDVLEKVEDFAKYTAFKLRSGSQPWLGQIDDSSDYKNIQEGMALDAIKNLEDMQIGTTKSVAFEFAINDQSEFLRGYAADGKSLDSKSLASMDALFNAYLAQNKSDYPLIMSQGGVLYESNEPGKR